MEQNKVKLRPFLYAACILSAIVGVEYMGSVKVLASEESSPTIGVLSGIAPEITIESPATVVPEATSVPISEGNSGGEETENDQEVTEILFSEENESGHNSFEFHGNNWVKASNEAYVDLPKDSPEIANHYYNINFVGNGIDLLAIKSHNHGIVDVYLNEEKHGTVDLYQARRGSVETVYSIRDLEEGEYTLRIQSTGKNNAANTRTNYVNQVVGAHIYHAPYRAESLSFAEESLTLKVGESKQLEATVTPTYITEPIIQYMSNDSDTVSVSETGRLLALKEGSARITATIDGISKEINVVVEAAIAQMRGSFVDNNLHYTSENHNQVIAQTQSTQRINVWRNDQANAQISIASVDSALKNVRYTLSDLVNSETGERLEGAELTANFIKELSGYRGKMRTS